MELTPPPITGLYAITSSAPNEAALLRDVSAAIEGGARIVQYRDKSNDASKREREARTLARLCHEAHAIFLVNDDVELAVAVGADGVHLGRDDVSLAEARTRLGVRAVIGVSCYNDLARARAAQTQGADYVAFGSFFPSRTKPQAVRASLELLNAARAALHIPIVAIGGITPENGAALVHAGADALAVIDGVFGQTDVRAAAARYTRLFTPS